jgi:Zn-dependent metalloprotease
VHVNSSIPSRAAYLAATSLGITKTRRIWYRALTTYTGPWATFEDFAYGTLSAAEDLYGGTTADALLYAWREVGVLEW